MIPLQKVYPENNLLHTDRKKHISNPFEGVFPIKTEYMLPLLRVQMGFGIKFTNRS
jgi:hypothetical protein